mgnify:CR=1 FL=1
MKRFLILFLIFIFSISAVSAENADLTEDDFIVGDGSLVGKEDAFEDVAGHFLALRPEWKKVENVNLLVPKYLKDTKEYLVK